MIKRKSLYKHNFDILPKPKELDKRYTGGYYFDYCIDFYYKQSTQFRNVREWCWQTWGPSAELRFVTKEEDLKWAWITDNYRIRIYFKSEAEVNWYKLRWF